MAREKQNYLIVIWLCIGTWQALYAQRVVVDLNSDWQFRRSVDSIPTSINLPHTYNAEDAFDDTPGYYRGEARYQKVLDTRGLSPSRHHYLKFGAVNQEATILINGIKAGAHVGGYTAFLIDVTGLLTFDRDTLEVIVNNRHHAAIPPLKGDFTFYGGIYRDVSLISVPRTHFSMELYGSEGIFIDPIAISSGSAEVRVRMATTHFDARAHRLVTLISDADQDVILSQNDVEFDGEGFANANLVLDRPRLWSDKDPYLYFITCQLLDRTSGQVLDAVTVPYGFRFFHFDAEEGFFLNGKAVRLMGVNRHQDLPGKGNALGPEDHFRDMQLIREMGANFLRTAHYPQDPLITQLCDRYGILVSMEIPLDHEITASEAFTENCKVMMREMIYQYYNHPSVIIWAYMNEMGLWKDIERDRQEMEAVAKLARELEDLVRAEDPYRYTMIPNHGAFEIYETFGLTDIPMIVGWNLYHGWYGPNFKGFGAFMDKAHAALPDKPMIITEYGAGADPRITAKQPKRFDFSLDWTMAFHTSYIKQITERPFIAASAVWNMFDFGSESRQDAVPHVNNKGLCSFDRQPKPVYFLYQQHLREDVRVQIPDPAPPPISEDYWKSHDLLNINFGTHFHFTEPNDRIWYPSEGMPEALLTIEGGQRFQPRSIGVGSAKRIALTTLDPVYQTQWIGAQQIVMHVPPGLYTVILHVSLLDAQHAYRQDMRLHDQVIRITAMQPFQAYQFQAEVRDQKGVIRLQFDAEENETFINGIQILRR